MIQYQDLTNMIAYKDPEDGITCFLIKGDSEGFSVVYKCNDDGIPQYIDEIFPTLMEARQYIADMKREFKVEVC